jgi:hypothetical protein
MKTALTFLACGIGLALGAITATLNFRYGLLIAAGQERWIYAIAGTFLDAGKTFLPTFMGTFLVGPLTPGMICRKAAGWSSWAVLITWSMICALGLYAIAKDARVGETAGQQAEYRQLNDDKPKKETRLKELRDTKSVETIEGDLAVLRHDRLWARTKECTVDTVNESREFCKKVETVKAAMANAPTAAKLMADVAKVETELNDIATKLAGVDMAKVMQKADPATDALAKFTGLDPERVKSSLAVFIAALLELGGLLPWIVTGSHGVRRHEPVPVLSAPAILDTPKPEVAAALEPPVEPANEEAELPKRDDTPDDIKEPAPAALALPEEEPIVATWCKLALVRRKGSFVPAKDVKLDFDAWCRANGHDEINKTAFGKELKRLGFTTIKRGGVQRYVDIGMVPKVREIRLVTSNAA